MENEKYLLDNIDVHYINILYLLFHVCCVLWNNFSSIWQITDSLYNFIYLK